MPRRRKAWAAAPRRLALAALLMTAACSVRPPIPTDGTDTIYVIQRAWHTEIGLPTTAGCQQHPAVATACQACDQTSSECISSVYRDTQGALQQRFPGVRVLVFGFGERQYLIDHDAGLAAMLRALLPSRSALLLTALRAPPEQAFGPDNVIALRVTPTRRKQIEATIAQAFETPRGAPPSPLAPGPYPGSEYYAARPTYDGFYTCNSWTADILRAGGFPMPAGVIFAGQVIREAKWIAARQAKAKARPIE